MKETEVNNGMINRLKKYEVISFDIYDTLIVRRVRTPSDVFELVQEKYNDSHENKIQNYKSQRIRAEIECRKQTDNEITIGDIYRQLYSAYGDAVIDLEKIEVNLEIELTNPNQEIFKIYKAAIELNKTILLISDMYLSKDTIKTVLKKNGIDNYKNLYISSECGCKKSTGELYEYVRQEEKIDKAVKWIHFGDNAKSDVINSYRNNIHPVLVKKKKEINDSIPFYVTSNDLDYDFGYNIVGPLMTGFIKWMGNTLEREKMNKVFFFSREGYFIKKGFETYYSHSKFDDRYIYVSRKSIVTPALCYELILNNISIFRPVGVKNAFEYLKSMGIKESNANKFLKEHNINNDESGVELFKYMDDLKQIVKEENIEIKKLLCEYLKQEGMEGNFAIVDIGWTGAMQAALDTVLSKEGIPHHMMGLFLAQRPEMNKISDFNINNKAWLCSVNGPLETQNILLASTGFIETIFMAPHGTTLGYAKEKTGLVVPNLAEYEYKNDYGKIKKIQEAAIEFITDYKSVGIDNKIVLEQEFAQRFLGFLKKPSKVYADRYGDILLSDTREDKLANTYTGFNVVRHLKNYNDSYWKIGYLRRNFNITLPYMWIYKVTRKIGMRMRNNQK